MACYQLIDNKSSRGMCCGELIWIKAKNWNELDWDELKLEK